MFPCGFREIFRRLHAKNNFLTAFLFLCKLFFFTFSAAFILAVQTFSADYGGTFKGAYKDEPISLNPLLEIGSVSTIVNHVIFDGLITITMSGEVLPRIAKSWHVSDDGLIWTFYLREDVKFHDGVRLTSEDVKFTYESAMNSPKLLSRKMLMDNIRKIEVVNDHTIKFILSKPGTSFLLNLYDIGVLPRHLLKGNPYENKEFNRNPVGTGSFKLKHWIPKKEILLEANKDYFDGRPYLGQLKLIHIPDIFLMWRDLQLGKIDGAYNEILPVDFDYLKRNPNLLSYRQLDYMNYVLIFNFSKEIFRDKRLRLAMSAAIDRQEIIEKALLGNGIECNSIFRPGAIDLSSNNFFDPETSLRLLDDLGYRDTDNDGVLEKQKKKLSFKVIIDSNNILKKRVLMVIQQQLMEIGIEITVEELPIPVIYEKALAGDFDMIFYNYNTSLDLPVLVWHSNSIYKGHNLSHYKNKKVDYLLDKLMATQDKGQRKKTMKLLYKVTTDDVAGIFLFTKYNLVSVNRRIQGFPEKPEKYFWEYVNNVYIPEKLQ